VSRILGSVRSRAAALAAALVAFATASPGCDDDPQSHVFVASPYEPASDCFGPSTSLAQIDTASGDLDCDPTCLVSTGASGDVEVYVSIMCGPYPPAYDATGTNPACASALAAWPAEASALANGSNSCASAPAPEDAAAE
jgi:hypothetical protein